MTIPLLLGLLSFVLCFVFTPVCRLVALKLGLVDKPDEGRKKQPFPIPRVGGFAIVLSYAAALGIMLMQQAPEQIHIQHYALLQVLLPPALLIFIVGLVDDLFTLRASHKLMGQVVACVTAAVLGHMYAPENFTFGMSAWTAPAWLSILICTFWLVLCTNAINLIDGLDGLASGVGLLGSVATLLFGLYTHNVGLLVATAPLTGALLAFLYYNFNPASIYLGDCGSLTIGFMLGAISLTWQRHGDTAFAMFAPICVLALPLLDVGIAIVRRYLRNDPIFSADRGHIHHVIQDRGKHPKTTALILYGACGVAVTLSLLAIVAPRGFRVVLILVFGVLLAAAIRHLDYAEFRAVRRVLSSRHMRQQVSEEIYLREIDVQLNQVRTVDDCWNLVEGCCKELGFATVEMFFQNLYFDAVLQKSIDENDWWLTLPLGHRGYLRVSRKNLVKAGGTVMPALDRLQAGLNRWEQSVPKREHAPVQAPAERPVSALAEI